MKRLITCVSFAVATGFSLVAVLALAGAAGVMLANEKITGNNISMRIAGY